MAETGSSRKSRNKEFEEVHLCTTLNDYVAIGGLRKQSGGAFLGRCVDETLPKNVNTGDEAGNFLTGSGKSPATRIPKWVPCYFAV